MKLKVTGGAELRRRLREVASRTAREAEKRAVVGWRESSSKYPSGQLPAHVGFIAQFGARGRAGRPYFTDALERAAPEVLRELGKAVQVDGRISTQRLEAGAKVLRAAVRDGLLRYRVKDSGHLYASIETWVERKRERDS